MERDKAGHYATGLACALLGVAYMLVRWGPVTHGGADFLAFFYPAGKQVLHGNLHYSLPRHYNTTNIGLFRYPPIAAEMFALFAWLPAKAAATAWWITGVLLMGATALLMATCADRSRGLFAGITFLSLAAFAPLAISIAAQLDIWIVALVAGAFALSGDRSRPRLVFAAGCLLGVAASLKIYPLLTIAIIVALRRSEARMLLCGAASSIAACLIIPLLTLGTGPLREYVHVLLTQGSTVLTAFPFAFGFLSIAYRGLVSTPYVIGSAHLDPVLVKALFVFFILCVLGFAGWRLRSTRASRGMVWVTAIVVTAVCSPFLEIQYLAPLALLTAMLSMDATVPMVPLVFGCFACGVASQVVSLRASEVLSVLVAASVGIWLLRGAPFGWTRRLQIAAFGGAFVLLATPAFLNVSSSWGEPMSLAQVVFGSAEYVFVLLVMLLTPRISWTAETTPLLVGPSALA